MKKTLLSLSYNRPLLKKALLLLAHSRPLLNKGLLLLSYSRPLLNKGLLLLSYSRPLLKKALLLLAVLPPLALAASGAWHASAPGPGLINRGMQASSPGLKAAEPVNGAITEINWRYRLSGPTPSGFAAWLCSENRCVQLDGASGSTRGLTNIQATETLHFVYGMQGRGRLPQTLRVLSNEVMVNYH